MKSPTRGLVVIEVVIYMAVVAGLAWLAKPSLFPGASKRAATSTATTAALVQAVDNQGAAAAASVAKIGEANTLAPDSPAKAFVAQEVPLALALLPPPDARALIEAERRRVAVMEGHLDEARRLYESASKDAAQLRKERDAALAARQAADLAFEQAAASEHAATVQKLIYGAIALLCAGGWLYLRFNHISPEMIGAALADVKHGNTTVTQAFDTLLSVRHQKAVNRVVKLAAP